MKGKNIVIVGASSGIGFSTAQLASARGASIFSISRNEPDFPATMNYEHCTHDILEDEFPAEFLPEIIDALMY